MKIEIIHNTRFRLIPEGKTDEIWIQNLPIRFNRDKYDFSKTLDSEPSPDNPYEIMMSMQKENRDNLMRELNI